MVCAAIGAAVFYPGVSVAGQQSESGVMTSVNPDLMRAALKPLNLEWNEVEDSDGLLSFHSVEDGAVRFALYQYQSEGSTTVDSLGISAGYDLDIRLDPIQMNQWNSSTRFSKAYVDSDGDPFLNSDLMLKPGVSLNAITEFVKQFQKSQAEFETKVLNRRGSVEMKLR